MREGEVFIPQSSMVYGSSLTYFPPSPTLRSTATDEQSMYWREKTGRKRGYIIKSDEEKTTRISGRRCPACGYIELYADEQTQS